MCLINLILWSREILSVNYASGPTRGSAEPFRGSAGHAKPNRAHFLRTRRAAQPYLSRQIVSRLPGEPAMLYFTSFHFVPIIEHLRREYRFLFSNERRLPTTVSFM